MRPSRTVRTALVSGALVAGLALALTGCLPQGGEKDPSGSPSASASRSGSAAPSTSASATGAPATPGTPGATTTPVTIACSSLVSDQTVYDFGPIWSAKSPFTPKSGTPAADAVADRGRACQWVNTSSGETIDLSVADYDAATVDALKAKAASGTAVSEWGADAAWFRTVSGVGEATAFVGGDWIVARSTVFTQAGDATPFVSSAVAALR